MFLLLFFKRHTELSQQFTSFFICFSSCYYDDIHTSNTFYLIIFDLREDELFFKTQSVVTTAIKCCCADTAEVTYTRQSQVDQTINERGNAALINLSRNSYMRSPRRVTFVPNAIPSRTLKFAMDFLAFVITGF